MVAGGCGGRRGPSDEQHIGLGWSCLLMDEVDRLILLLVSFKLRASWRRPLYKQATFRVVYLQCSDFYFPALRSYSLPLIIVFLPFPL